MAAKLVSLIFALVLARAHGVNPCFVEDQRYTTATPLTVPSLFVQSPEDCQTHCKLQALTCKFFSYSTLPDKANNIFTPGACWLVDGTAVLKEGSGFIAGPAVCPGSETTAAPTLAGADGSSVGPYHVGKGEQCNPTVSPAYQKLCNEGFTCTTPTEGMLGASGVCQKANAGQYVGEGEACNPTVAPASQKLCKEGFTCTTPTEGLLGASGVCQKQVSAEAPETLSGESTGGGGFPVWGYALIVVGVIGVGLAAYFFACSGKAPKKKKATSKKRGARLDTSPAAVSTQDAPNSVAETEPLIRQQAAAPVQTTTGASMAMGQMMPAPSQMMPMQSQMMMPAYSQMMPAGSIATTPLPAVANPYAQPLPSYQFVQSGPMAEPAASYMSHTATYPQQQQFIRTVA